MNTSPKTGDGLRVMLITGEIHINTTLDEEHAEIALLQMQVDVLASLGGIVRAPALSAVRHGDPSSGCGPGGLA